MWSVKGGYRWDSLVIERRVQEGFTVWCLKGGHRKDSHVWLILLCDIERSNSGLFLM